MGKHIYYLPGNGGLISTGVGEELLKRGFDVSGRETVGEFRKLPFQKQIDLIKSDLLDLHWSEDDRVIANSFGAFLFLHAQAQLSLILAKFCFYPQSWGSFHMKNRCVFLCPPDLVSCKI